MSSTGITAARVALVAAAVATLAGCGGGGSSTPAAPRSHARKCGIVTVARVRATVSVRVEPCPAALALVRTFETRNQAGKLPHGVTKVRVSRLGKPYRIGTYVCRYEPRSASGSKHTVRCKAPKGRRVTWAGVHL